jgi:hypothetical protein
VTRSDDAQEAWPIDTAAPEHIVPERRDTAECNEVLALGRDSPRSEQIALLALAAKAREILPEHAGESLAEVVARLAREAGMDYLQGFVDGFLQCDIEPRRLRCARYLEGLEDGWLAYRRLRPDQAECSESRPQA